MATKSPFRKGRAAVSASSGGGQFISLKPDEQIVLAPVEGLDGMISADMHEYWDIRPAIFHPCIGRGCPGCEVGNEPRFKGYLPVLPKNGEVAVYPFTISVYNQLEGIEDALDEGENLKGFILKISRQGSGMKTRYQIVPIGKRVDVSEVDVPDFIPQLGPQTADAIWELLEENGFDRTGKRVMPEAEETTGTAVDDDWGEV